MQYFVIIKARIILLMCHECARWSKQTARKTANAKATVLMVFGFTGICAENRNVSKGLKGKYSQ